MDLPAHQSWQEVFARYRSPIILGGVSLLLIVIAVGLMISMARPTSSVQFSSESTQSAVFTRDVVVDIEGAVVSPGVYTLPAGSRIEDAIKEAGGLSKSADLEAIARALNRAAEVVDGGKIYIPGTSDSSSTDASAVYGIQTSQTGTISVNFASQSELETLPGVGPVTAKKIIDNRPYQTLEELVSHKVLYQSTYDKLKDQLSL